MGGSVLREQVTTPPRHRSDCLRTLTDHSTFPRSRGTRTIDSFLSRTFTSGICTQRDSPRHTEVPYVPGLPCHAVVTRPPRPRNLPTTKIQDVLGSFLLVRKIWFLVFYVGRFLKTTITVSLIKSITIRL